MSLPRLFKDTVIYSIGSLLNPLLGFILLPLYTRYLSPDEYGVVTAIYSLVLLFKVYYSFSLEKALLRLYWKYESEEERVSLLSSITWATIGLIIAASLISYIFLDSIKLIFSTIRDNKFYLVGWLILVEQVIIDLILTQFRIKELAGRYVLLSLSNFVAKSVLVIIFLVYFNEGLDGYFSAEMYKASLFIFIYLWILSKHVKVGLKIEMIKDCIRFSFPYVPGMTAAWVITQSSTVFIITSLSLADAGIYAVSVKIASTLRILDSSFRNAYFPFYFKSYSKNTLSQSIAILKKSNTLYLVVLMFASLCLILLTDPAVDTLLDIKFRNVKLYVPGLVLAALMGGFSATIIGAGLQQHNKTVADNFFGIAVAVTAFLGNYYFINIFGLNGAVYTRIVSVIFLIILLLFYSTQRGILIPLNIRLVVTIFLVVLSVYCFSIFLRSEVFLEDLMTKVLLLLVSGVIIVLLTVKVLFR